MPVLFSDTPAKVAVPPLPAVSPPPVHVEPPASLLPSTALFPSLVVTALSLASRTCTVIAGVIDAPAAVLPGCCTHASLVAVPGVMSHVLLVAPGRPVLAAVSV